MEGGRARRNFGRARNGSGQRRLGVTCHGCRARSIRVTGDLGQHQVYTQAGSIMPGPNLRYAPLKPNDHSDATKEALKEKLLRSMEQETEPNMARKLANVVG